MMSKNTGGPAFPLPSHTRKWDEATQEYLQDEGMTLRDYFAAKAMQGMFANPESCRNGMFREQNFATAYKAADAMLKAREA